MVREVIILSDLDLNILKFVKEEKFIKELVIEFQIDYLMMKLHLDRLIKINCVDVERFGTFKKIVINKCGEDILKLLWHRIAKLS